MKNLWWGIVFGSIISVLLLAPDSKFSYRLYELLYIFLDSLLIVVDEHPDFAQSAMIFIAFNIFVFFCFNLLFIKGKITIAQLFGIAIKFLSELTEFSIGVLKKDVEIIFFDNYLIHVFAILLVIFLINYLMYDGEFDQRAFLVTFIDSVLALEFFFIGLMFNSLAN